MGSDCYTYADAAGKALELEALLESLGLSIRPGSDLEAAALSGLDILYRRLSPSTADWRSDLRQAIANMVGIAELGTHLLVVKDHPDFRQLMPHLSLLNQGQALQTRASSVLDQAANKIFELVIACWVMAAGGENVTLDNPQTSKGENPDVLFTFNGCRWGIACKCPHSINPQTLVDNLSSGIAQIERSEAERGIVIMSAKNLINHAEFFRLLNTEEWRAGAEPVYKAFVDRGEPFQKLKEEVDRVLMSVQTNIGVKSLKALFAGSKTIPAIVVWAHTVSAVVLDEEPVPTSVRTLIVGHLSEPEPLDKKLFDEINNAAMAIP